MASKAGIAKRYSRALWLLGRSVDEAESWAEPLEVIAKTISDSKDLLSLLESPAFAVDQKEKALLAVLDAEKAPETLKNFMRALLRAGRVGVVSEVADAYRKKILESKHALEAVVETAFPLGETAEKKLVSHLEKLCGKKLVVKIKVVPDLLAGLRVHVGGKTLDFTFTAQINKLERWLHQAQA